MPRDAKHPPTILVADDDRWLLESMSDWLSGNGYRVFTAQNPEAAYALCQQQSIDLVLSDIRFDAGHGLGWIRKIHRQRPELPILAMSGYFDSDAACDCIAAGAFDFLTKPIRDVDLQEAIERALTHHQLAEENRRLQQQLEQRSEHPSIQSQDPRMNRILDTIERVADTRATILITGENGTGKSRLARSIHRRSSRREAPFVEVACGALPDALLESELFGHVAGAFTGATMNKAGKFQLANHGTLFLDEIGLASMALQVKLLRVLQELQFEPLGGSETLTVDTRTILATNEDLERSVAEGRFRQDLFYRVHVIRLELPPLRERIADIAMLAQHFVERASQEFHRDVKGITTAAMRALEQYRWPGNIRELENAMQRAVLLCCGTRIDLDLLQDVFLPHPARLAADSTTRSLRAEHPSDLLQPSSAIQRHRMETRWSGMSSATLNKPVRPLAEALEGPEREIILHALAANQWNRHATAEQLGINRTTLYKKMKKLGIDSGHPEHSDDEDLTELGNRCESAATTQRPRARFG